MTCYAHRIGRKARGRIDMARAALNPRHRDVRRGQAFRHGAVVTGGTSRRDPGVIHLRRAGKKADRALVAVSARSSGDDMIGRFTQRRRAIVAGRARCARLDMVDEAQLAPRRREVTAFTEIRRLRMR